MNNLTTKKEINAYIEDAKKDLAKKKGVNTDKISTLSDINDFIEKHGADRISFTIKTGYEKLLTIS